MINMVIFASGEGSNAERLMEYFSAHPEARITWIITNREKAGVVQRAKKFRKGIQFITSETLNEMSEQLVEFLRVEKTDLILLAGFLLKVPSSFISAFPDRIINLHPSLLPKYGGKGMYGIHVHRAVIENKESNSGITIHLVNEEYDKGEILLQHSCTLENGETAESLAEKIKQLEHAYYPRAVEEYVQKIKII
jgi:phosphoribosylglycinamide formyltransferase 1